MANPREDKVDTWEQRFSELFQNAVEKYQKGHRKAAGLVDARGQNLLLSIGYTEQEFFDFVEDFAKGGEPVLDAALKIARVRHDYFFQEQKGKVSPHRISMEELPSKDAEIEGIGWLPRLIAKAEAKLRGEMPPELMYCCGGDRKFFKTHRIDPDEFLRQVWSVRGDPSQLAAWVKTKSAHK